MEISFGERVLCSASPFISDPEGSPPEDQIQYDQSGAWVLAG